MPGRASLAPVLQEVQRLALGARSRDDHPMRASQNEATGTSGESEVQAEFERLGWGVVPDSRHDTGTDLFLRPRDPRRFELGVIMGAQVKTGPSWFESPHRDNEGAIDGWWFAEGDRRHFDYWIGHAVPHVLILRNQYEDTSYWVHVTASAVLSTGRGAKILVPRSQTVGMGDNDALTEVALTQLPTTTWEGSAWSGAKVLPRDRVRHALVAPRLIAPHPNAKPAELDGIHGLAAAVLIRQELERLFSARDVTASRLGWDGPSLDEALQSQEWAWRAAAALYRWLYEGDTGPIEALIDCASSSEQMAAATVMGSLALMEDGRVDEARALLEAALNPYDDIAPSDYAWLQANLAWVLYELGQWEDAIDHAFGVLRARRASPTDVTLSALAGSATLVIFRASGWQAFAESEANEGSGGQRIAVGDLIGNTDNPANWWRSQLLAWALPAELEGHMRTWTQDRSLILGGHDRAHRLLRSAALLSGYAADGDGWRSATAMLAKHLLLQSKGDISSTDMGEILQTLHRGGDSSDIKKAVRRVVRDGPVLAVAEAARGLDPARSTHSSAAADLAMLAAAGDVLEASHADALCNWAIVVLRDPRDYLARVRPSFTISNKLLELLSSVVPAASPPSQRSVIDLVLDNPPISGSLEDQDMARVIRQLPDGAWTEEQTDRAIALSKGVAGPTVRALQRLTAKCSSDVRNALFEEAAQGSLGSLEGVGPVTELPPEGAAALIRALSDRVSELTQNAQRGRYGGGGMDSLRELTLMNCWHPEHAEWEPVLAALKEPAVQSDQLVGVLSLLGRLGERVPGGLRPTFVEAISALRKRAPRGEVHEQEDVRGLALEALWSMGVREGLRQALLGGPAERRSAALVIGRAEHLDELNLLALLSRDSEPEVRSAAAHVLGSWAARGIGGQEVIGICSKLLPDSGTLIAAAVASALGDHPTVAPEARGLMDGLTTHPSAQVRALVTGVT